MLAETWTVRKPAIESAGGIVVSQHVLASRAGAEVLAAGGNAVDVPTAGSAGRFENLGSCFPRLKLLAEGTRCVPVTCSAGARGQ